MSNCSALTRSATHVHGWPAWNAISMTTDWGRFRKCSALKLHMTRVDVLHRHGASRNSLGFPLNYRRLLKDLWEAATGSRSSTHPWRLARLNGVGTVPEFAERLAKPREFSM